MINLKAKTYYPQQPISDISCAHLLMTANLLNEKDKVEGSLIIIYLFTYFL